MVILAVLTASGIQHYRAPLAGEQADYAALSPQLAFPTGGVSEEREIIIGHVVRVLSADTVIVRYGGGEEAFRLEGVFINRTPSTARDAAEFVRHSLDEKQIRLEISRPAWRDSLGRRQARIHVGGEDLSQLLIARNFASSRR